MSRTSQRSQPNGPPSHIGSESEDSEQTDETNGRTSKPRRSCDDFNGHFTTFDIKDLDSVSTSRHSTFPSIRFARSSSQQNDDDNGSSGSDSDDGLFDADGEDNDNDDLDDPFGWSNDRKGKPIPMNGSGILRRAASPPVPRKTLYIQMVRRLFAA